MRVLLVTPPMTQLNTPYPATAYLTGCLRQHAPEAVEVAQVDLSIELFLRLFSRSGLAAVQAELDDGDGSLDWFSSRWQTYAALVEPVVRFLQGHDPSLAMRIAGRAFLPEGPRFTSLGGNTSADGDDLLGWAFGELGVTDRARHLASLFVDDLADVIRQGIDPRFELSRYGEKLASSAARFDPLADALDGPPTVVDRLLDDLARGCMRARAPDVVGLTVPFPGNLYGALRIARIAKAERPSVKVVLGGGYVNTELRQLGDARVFDACDFITLDDGERPLLALVDHLRDPTRPLFRTYVREAGAVVLKSTPALADLHHRDTGTPTYDGLPLDRYVSLFEMLNPMHRLWADGRWNKLTVARGCYWKQCTFCDVSLDYIARYEPASADVTVDRIEALVRETGETGFHFVDEAAPPAMLRALSERLIERRVAITWWGNIRFEQSFTPELCRLLARSGCVAISGGLEVASDRLLALMKKGVTVDQVARVSRAFADAGVMVHAYLMYGFPTETAQETVDALERVRQLFAEGCIQSAFWHRFAATAHSPIGRQPEVYGIRLAREPVGADARSAKRRFARNELAFVDPTGCDHERFGPGLRRALYNFMHGIGLDQDVRSWFAPEAAAANRARAPSRPSARRRGGQERWKTRAAIPKPRVPADLIRRALAGGGAPARQAKRR